MALIRLRAPWKVSATIQAGELDIDTDKDEFNISVEFDYQPEDKEVGICMDYMEYSGWSTDEKLTEEEESAIDEYLYSHADELYSDRAYEMMCEYAEYCRELRYDR